MMLRGRSGPVSRSLAAYRGVVDSARSVHSRQPLAGVRTPWNGPQHTVFPPLRGGNGPTLLGVRAFSEVKIDFIHPADAKKLVQEGAIILDVRGEREFQLGALPGATNIPHDDPDLVEMVAEITNDDMQKPIVVYDKVGKRAETAKAVLIKAGHKTVVNLGGHDEVGKFLELPSGKSV